MRKLFKMTTDSTDALNVISEWSKTYGERLIHFKHERFIDGRSAVWGKALTVKEMKGVSE